jgi:uncharacterized membrane protein YbhN (UPF0104 family)
MEQRQGRRKRWKMAAGVVLGVGLLAAALVFAVRGTDWSVWQRIGLAELAGLVLLVWVNVGLTGLLFWAVTRGFGARPAVGPGKMTGLIAVSGLLNYVPVVRAGLWGRAVYLKKYHGVAVRDSLRILVIVLGLVLPLTVGRWLPVPSGAAWAWVPLRLLDYGVATARLWVCFAVLGEAVDWRQAAVLGAASMLTKLSGLTPNGLGLAEWVVAGLAALVSPLEAASAASAALLDRAAEVVGVVGSGAVGLVVLRPQPARSSTGAGDAE